MQQAERSQRASLRRFTFSRRGYEITEVDQFVAEVRHQLTVAHERIQLLEGQLDQLSHENEALTKMINHVARLGEQMVAEARQEANDIVSGARVEAQERVIVARADAKTLVSEERRRVADELEMLAVVRETVVRERDTLLSFHSDLNDRLREVVTSIVNYSNDDEIHALAAIGGIIPPELAPSRSARPSAPVLDYGAGTEEIHESGDTGRGAADHAEPDDTAGADVVSAADDGARAESPPGPVDGVRPGQRYGDFETPEMLADEGFDRAFSSFMGNDLAHEPSREWMINGK